MTKYRPVNKCIYCGSDGIAERPSPDVPPLTDEHIVPYALQGQYFLPSATCHACMKTTSALEGRCASINYGSFRILENLQTRRPKKRPTELPMKSEDDVVHLLPKDCVIGTLPIFRFNRPAGHLTNPLITEPGFDGWVSIEIRTRDPKRRDLWATIPTKTLTVNQGCDYLSHARLLAKIAHTLGVAHFGVDAFDHFLPPYIVGTNPNLPYVVGGFDAPEAPEKVDHNYTYLARFDGDSYLLAARIRLFAAVGGPWAEVVVGRTSRERIAARKPYAIDFEEKEFDPQTGAVLRLIRSPAEP